MKDGPLDMRMDTSQPLRAAELVNSLDEKKLGEIIASMGGEPRFRRIASEIVRERKERPIETTARLAAVAARAVGGQRGRIHPATRTFQALRIAVNCELEALEQGLSAALLLLNPLGRLAVLSYHSLEDGAVKRIGNAHVGRKVSLAEGGVRMEGVNPPAIWITKKPLTASDSEKTENSRSRSAKLRVLERTMGEYGQTK